MKIVYISSACYPNNVDEINKTAIKKLEISGIKFHNLLIKGMVNNGVDITSIVGLPISSKTNSKKIWKKRKETIDNIEYRQVGFINLPILKQLTTTLNMFFEYCKIIKKNKDVYAIVDATYITVLPLIVFASKLYKVPIVGIVADIYDYMCEVDNNNGKGRLITKWIRKFIGLTYLKLDKFILLTEQMNEVINLNKRPYIVIEGCADSSMKQRISEEKEAKKVILYSGKLAEKFGIKLLVDSFINANVKDSELWIYGDGEEKQYVIDKSNSNSNIKYMGMVSNEEVVKAQQRALLLVNPRPTSAQYTKYSFPSKNIEYMASGTSMLTTNLPGMPEEYKEYVYLFNEETVESFANTISCVLNKPVQELNATGKKAQEYILNYKNEKVQSKKIIDFIKNKGDDHVKNNRRKSR